MANIVICKDCGGQVSKSAKFCPHCGAKRKKSPWRVAVGTILLFVGIILFAVAIAGNGDSVQRVANEITLDNITMAEFEAVETGMTYDEVVEIIGSTGELTSQVDIGASTYKTEIYTWYGVMPGANANVTFQGGKVIAKAQIGLS